MTPVLITQVSCESIFSRLPSLTTTTILSTSSLLTKMATTQQTLGAYSDCLSSRATSPHLSFASRQAIRALSDLRMQPLSFSASSRELFSELSFQNVFIETVNLTVS
jgi:hypothetical protein